MATTIQVQEKTLRLLKREKARLKSSTYDELIQEILEKRRPSSGGMFGVDKGRIQPFTEEDHLDFHED